MSSSSKATPMTKDESMILVDLVAGNKIIMNNATNNKLKEEAWQILTDQFNASVTSCRRNASQLRLRWENLKKSARKRCANMRSNKTGGGKDFFPPDEVLDKVAVLLGSTCEGFPVEFGEDATTADTVPVAAQVNLEDEEQNLFIIPGNENNNGVGSGVGVH